MNNQRRHEQHRPYQAQQPIVETPTPIEEEPVVIAPPEQEREPQEWVWEDINLAPRDGRDLIIRYGADDTEGRVVRWKNQRRFTGRKWVTGGRWMPTDSMMPLSMEEPTEWARPPGYSEEEAVAEDAIDEQDAA